MDLLEGFGRITVTALKPDVEPGVFSDAAKEMVRSLFSEAPTKLPVTPPARG